PCTSIERMPLALLLLAPLCGMACDDGTHTQAADAGCPDPFEPPGRTDAGAGVNSAAWLIGPPVGTGVADVGSLRKPLDVTPLPSPTNSRYRIGPAYAMRLTATGDARDAAFVAFPVTNVTDQSFCFIFVDHYRWLDDHENPLRAEMSDFV